MSASTEVLGTYQCIVRKKSDTNFCRLTCVSRPGFLLTLWQRLLSSSSWYLLTIMLSGYKMMPVINAASFVLFLLNYEIKKFLIWSKDISSIRFHGFAFFATCSHISPKCTTYKVPNSWKDCFLISFNWHNFYERLQGRKDFTHSFLASYQSCSLTLFN